MINKLNVDVQIYLDKLLEGINQLGMIEDLSEEWGIEKEKIKESLGENLALQSSIKFEETGNPILDGDEFEKAVAKSAIECTLELMVEKGILDKGLNPNDIENSYSLRIVKNPNDFEKNV